MNFKLDPKFFQLRDMAQASGLMLHLDTKSRKPLVLQGPGFCIRKKTYSQTEQAIKAHARQQQQLVA